MGDKTRWYGLLAATVLAGMPSCDDTNCVPGQQIACACTGAEEGSQVCLPSGEGYAACECPGAGGQGGAGAGPAQGAGGVGGAGASSEGAGGMGGAVRCTPNETTDCYDGPAGTLDVGICIGGLATCHADGMGFGLCEGQTLPGTENCSTPDDEDCDGQTPPCDELWSVAFAGTEGIAGVNRLVVDAQGNIVVLGNLRGSVSIAGGPAQQYWYGVLFKLDSAGNLVFSLPFGDPIDISQGLGVAVDDLGNIFLTGTYQGDLVIDGETLSAPTSMEMFLAKLDPAGNSLWAISYDATVAIQPAQVVALSGGDIVIPGFMQGQVYFGGPSVLNMSTPGMFLVRLDTDGGFVWADTYPYAFPYDAVAGPNDEIAVVGGYNAPTDLGGGTLPSINGWGAAFFGIFDQNGDHLASDGFNGNGYPSFHRVAMSSTGEIAVLAWAGSQISMDLGGGALPGSSFVAGYDASGGHLFSHGYLSTGSSGQTALVGLGTGNADEIMLGGVLRGDIDFGGGNISGVPLGELGVWLRLDSSGNWLSNDSWGLSMASLSVNALAGYPDGSTIAAGTYGGPASDQIDLGFGAFPLANSGGAWIARLAP